MGERGLVTIALVSLLLVVGSFTNTAQALSVDQAVTAIADKLEADQIKEGVHTGSWPQEAWFTGAIVAGMADAYEVMGRSVYKASAELGGNYIVEQSQGNFYDSEALALTRLSEIAKDPADNMWRSAASSFYKAVKYDFEGGTNAYISSYAGLDPSIVVSYLANHTVAADYVGATDSKIWRQGLISWLSHVDDACIFPVMALGAATWALAQTGPLDETLIDPFGNGAPYWNMKRLKDLPGLLLSYQVPDGQPGAGGFYWRFDHGDGGSGQSQGWGYTEDAIFGTLGLIAASKGGFEPDEPNLVQAILSAREALIAGVRSDGVVFELLSQEGSIYYVYAGEMLIVLKELELFFAEEPASAATIREHLLVGNDRSALFWAARTGEGGVPLGYYSGNVVRADLRLQQAAKNVEPIAVQCQRTETSGYRWIE
jgi:hypothetical protein